MNLRLITAITLSILPGALKKLAYRALGMRIAPDVRLGFAAVLACREVELLSGASIGPFCLLRCDRLRMGARARIDRLVRITVHTLSMGSQTTISSPNEIAGDQNDPRSVLTMGPATWILPYCFVNVAREIKLGRNVGVGGGSYLFTHGLWLSKLDGYPVSYGGIEIGNDVWLPWGCFIMPGVMIGSGAVVGARSVVNKSLPPGVLAAGSPAKVIREQARTVLSFAQRADILAEISTDFAASSRGHARIVDRPSQIEHWINDRLVVVVHKDTATPIAWAELALNVSLDTPLSASNAQRYPCWSAKDHRSSPLGLLPTEVKAWLLHARQAGIRFYPLDEDAV